MTMTKPSFNSQCLNVGHFSNAIHWTYHRTLIYDVIELHSVEHDLRLHHHFLLIFHSNSLAVNVLKSNEDASNRKKHVIKNQ
jgi:hypothetical protein